MEKETLISELKTRVGETILSERSLTEYATNILPMVPSEGEIPDSFWSAHVGILKSMEGQLRNEKAQFAKSFEEQWKKNHPDNITTPPAGGSSGDDGKGKPSGTNGMEEMIKQLIESQKEKDANLLKQIETYSKAIKEMQDKMDAKEKQARIADTRTAISKALRGFGEVNEGILRQVVENINLESGKEESALVEEAKNIYSKLYKEIFGDSGIPFNGNGGNDPDNGIVNSFIKQVQESEKTKAEKMEAQKKMLI